MVKVSVIIPIYNTANYLKPCLESIMQQTLKEIEIICINDGSTDDSRTIVEEFQKYDKRIILINKENGGLSSARNEGIKRAGGRYVIFCDSDDYLERNALEFLYDEAERDKLEIVDFDAVSFFESDEVKDRHRNYINYYLRNDYSQQKMSGQEFLAEEILGKDFKPSACLHFIKKEFLETFGIRFYEGIIHEDHLFTIESLILASHFKYVKRNFYHRRVHENSIMTRTSDARNIYGYFITLIELINLIKNSNVINPITKKALIIYIKDIEGLIYDSYCQSEQKELGNINGNDELEVLFNTIVKYPLEIVDLRQGKIERELEDVRNSLSYKIGRTITFLPRKARRIMKVWIGKLKGKGEL